MKDGPTDPPYPVVGEHVDGGVLHLELVEDAHGRVAEAAGGEEAGVGCGGVGWIRGCC